MDAGGDQAELPDRDGVPAGVACLLTVRQVATVLAVDERTLRAWIAAGKIGCVKLSKRCLRIPPDALERFISQRRQDPDDP